MTLALWHWHPNLPFEMGLHRPSPPFSRFTASPNRYEQLLRSHGGEYGRLLGPSGGAEDEVAACVGLVLRLLDCELTPQDTAFLFHDRCERVPMEGA